MSFKIMRSALKSACFGRKLLVGSACEKFNFVPSVLHCKAFSSDSTCHETAGPIYELRIYCIYPVAMKNFLELSKEKMHLRLGHSKLVGYWTSEIGGLNDVVHIWEYDNLSHRASVRQALAGDPVWIESYFSKILPMMMRQENHVLASVPGTLVKTSDKKGVYELEELKIDRQTDLTALSKCSDEPADGYQLLGSFYNVIGKSSTGYILWYHLDVDSLLKRRHQQTATGDIHVPGHSRLLLPTAWSPLA